MPSSAPLNRAESSGARNCNERLCLIVNPAAGAGRAGREIGVLERAADRAFAHWEIRQTEAQGHATALARAAVADGFDLVAAVGGDGTCSEVVSGMFDGDRPLSRTAAFAVIPFGTGSDLIRTLQVPRSLSEALWVAATGITLPTDVGYATIASPSGPLSRPFINVAGFGANGEVVAAANAMDKRWGGTLTFLRATVQTLLSYQPAPLRITWESPSGPGAWEGRLTSAFVANGAYCGGGMWVGKGGTMQDGLFDLTLLPEMPIHRQLLSSPKLYNGRLDRLSGAVRAQVTTVRATPLESNPVRVDLDGEMPGHLPGEFRILPRALQVRGGWTRSPLLGA